MRLKLKFIPIFILTILTIVSHAQIPKGYYFGNIKGTTWFSTQNISDAKILNETEIWLKILKSQSDTLRHNIWAFADDLTITYYNVSTNKYNVLLTCKYSINEKNKTIVLQANNMKEIKFNYNSVSTGNYVMLSRHKMKKKK